MACNTCITACPVFPCYDNLWLFKATADTTYLVKITNMGSGRVVSESVESDAEGFVILTGNTWADFFNTGAQVKFEIYEMVGSTYTNIPVDFRVITGFSGGSYASQQATISTTYYDCVYVSFEMLHDTDSTVTVDNQYLYNTNA